MTFQDCLKIILQIEGGYNLDPDDPGGATKFGISKRSYPQLDIFNLTQSEAEAIYKKDYWERFHIEDLPDFFRLTFFDCCVNQGGPTAVKLLQGILLLKVDGIIGPATIEDANGIAPNTLVYEFAMSRFQSYIDNKNFSTFGIGWLNRLLKITIMGDAR